MATLVGELVGLQLDAALAGARRELRPFRHWTVAGLFAPATLDRLLALPIPARDKPYDKGTRESNDSSRVFFDAAARARHEVCAAVAEGFQRPETVRACEDLFGIPLAGCYLRLEYAQDTDGFWLEPHTDIRVKRLTLLVYLSRDPDAADYGTDLYERDGTHAARVPFASNHGLAFVPGDDTWHGFERRPMLVVRRTLIVNYVTADWRDRFELAYPDEPVSSTCAA